MAIDHSHLDLTAVVQNVQIDSSVKAQAPIERVSTWHNWSGNLSYKPTSEDGQYYFLPETEAELISIVNQAALKEGGIKLRISGQRHSVPPLIVNSNLNNPEINTQHGSQWIVDLSCYKDLDGNNNITLNTENQTVTVNTGVTMGELDAYLTAHNLMLPTVTAAGFFSIGGVTAVDVHGATVNSSILADTVVSYTVMNDRGQKITYDANSKSFQGYNPLAFHRASLGTLGIITSVTFKVIERPYKNTLVPSQSYYSVNSEQEFIKTYKDLLFSGQYDRVESFYNPYSDYYNVLALRWSIDKNPLKPILNDPTPKKVQSACEIAQNRQWGAPFLSTPAEIFVQNTGQAIQNSHSQTQGEMMISKVMNQTTEEMNQAIQDNEALWVKPPLTRVTFMTYFVPLPNNKDHGLDVAWRALKVVKERLLQTDDFISVLPPEFRFVRGSDAFLAGVYSDNPNQLFIAIEVLAMVSKGDATKYGQNTLDFFANIEHQWVEMGGFPHQGKMFGFYDPSKLSDSANIQGEAAFNPIYIKSLNARRSERLKIFSEYKKMIDPTGIFSNGYTDSLLES